MGRGCDLVLICGRRPELLARTLESFGEKVFAYFTFGAVIANIDPFCGTDAEGGECERLIRARFPQAQVFRPEVPGFAAAVIRTWAATRAEMVLHLEDDWLAIETLEPARIEAALQGEVKALTLMSATKNTRNQQFQTSRRRVRHADGSEEDIFVNAFSTSPGFFEGDFLRRSAALMLPEFDPEKQFFRSLNPALETYAMQYRCRFLFGREGPFLVQDIGRDWRDARRIGKWLVKGQSVWAPLPDPQPDPQPDPAPE
ncbi:MAG: hypothetical protein JSR87_12005 [Proteobacteria bacterium]|nr:hypothetical protein [Pseudomonadota bacterium]MBS0572524.1 hypothetical protein [Pseudomonadota bacterium]